MKQGAPPPRRRIFSGERVLLAVLMLLLLGFLHVAYVARTVYSSSKESQQRQPNGDAQSMPTNDSVTPERPAFRVGLAMPARGPPSYALRGCAFMGRHHLEDRFVRDDACFKRSEITAIIRALVVHAAQVLEAHDITYFLESGTLLGAYRHQDVIPHDDDGDLAIDRIGFARLRSQRLPFDETLYAIDVWDSPHYENGGRDAKLSARLIHKASALYVDVFVFYDRVESRTKRAMVGPVASDCYSNCVYCPRVSDGKKQLLVPREWVYPLQDCAFGGHMLKCPAKMVEYLTHEYGENFMDPI